MKHPFPLGQDDAGRPFLCDLERLVDTRLLVQANSGGGKSYLVRRLLEQTHGHVQHLVVDPEGEFASLRERYDYVLAAPRGGDTLAEPRSAALLAERLLELRASAILDIYELKAHDRVRFVRLFLEALINAPKRLWHPALVIVDEVHVMCPEKGEAESAGAVIDLATRGRKRGFCAVLATQRLAKLNKDAAAECNNVLIGRTGLDVDLKRAGDVLGFTKDRWSSLRELDPGQFYAFGPALSRTVTRLTVGNVRTTHPKAGARLAFTAPPPTEKIRALLPKLADLPAEAAERQRTVEDLEREVSRLKGEVRRAQEAQPAPLQAKTVERPVLSQEHRQQLFRSVKKVADLNLAAATGELVAACRNLENAYNRLVAVPTMRGPESPTPGPRTPVAPAPVHPIPARRPRTRDADSTTGEGAAGLTDTQRRILDTIAMLEVRGIVSERVAVARWMAIHPNGGRYGTDCAALRAAGYLDGWILTPKGAAFARTLATGPDAVLAALPDDTKRRLFETLLTAQNGRAPFTRDTLAAELGIHPNGGRYGTDLAWLRAMSVIPERGPIAPTAAVFR